MASIMGVITLPTMCTGTTEMVDRQNKRNFEAFSVMGLVPQLTVGVALGFGAQSDSVADCDF